MDEAALRAGNNTGGGRRDICHKVAIRVRLQEKALNGKLFENRECCDYIGTVDRVTILTGLDRRERVAGNMVWICDVDGRFFWVVER
ncbi:MAG: hypothetical protein ACNA71_05775 [Kiritimatiellia bacterium]